MHTELYETYEESYDSYYAWRAGQQQASCGHFSDMATLDSWLNRKKGKPPDVAGKPPNAVATLSVQDDSYTGTNVTPEQAASS